MTIATGEQIISNDFWRAVLTTTKTNSGIFAEETILTATLPANSLVSGRTVRVTCNFEDFSGANGGITVRLKLGSTTIASLSLTNAGTEGMPAMFIGYIRYTGTNAQIGGLNAIWSRDSSLTRLASSEGTGTETLSNALAVTLTVQGDDTIAGGIYRTNDCVFELI